MTRFSRLTALATGALILTLPVFAACGGDDDSGGSTPDTGGGGDDPVELDTWTAGLCDSVTTWLNDVTTLSNDLDFEQGATPEDVKDVMVEFLTDIDTRTKEFRTDVGGLGEPDTDDGPEIQSAFEAASEDVVTIFEDALADAKELDTTDPAKLQTQLVELGDAITAASDEVSDTFSQIDQDFDTTEITKAAEDIPECEEIFAS